MRWRNQILALLCLTIFAALGVLYFRHWVVQKPFGIVLFIGEGLTPERVAMTRLYAGGAETRLTIESLPAMALLSNSSADFAVPDEAAAAMALAAGAKVRNGSVGLDRGGKRLKTLIDLAREKGRAIGLVTNGRLTSPTAAAFYARGNERPEGFARQFAEERKVDIALGGGWSEFLPEAKGGARSDGRDLILELRRNGFEVVRTKAELENLPRWRRTRLLGVFSGGEMAYANRIATGSEQPGLPDMTRRAIELLQWNPGGYLLIVDAALMGTAARQNQGELTLAETVGLDQAVAIARSYAGKNSTIMVTGNLGIGGMSLNGAPFRRDKGIALLGMDAAGLPAVTWATGPKGPKAEPTPGADSRGVAGPSDLQPNPDRVEEPAAVYAPAAEGTASDVLAAGSGPGSDALHGFLDNTAIFEMLRDQL